MKKGQKRWNWRERVKDEDLCKETGEETKEERKRGRKRTPLEILNWMYCHTVSETVDVRVLTPFIPPFEMLISSLTTVPGSH